MVDCKMLHKRVRVNAVSGAGCERSVISAPSNVFLQQLRKHQNVSVMQKLAADSSMRLNTL